MDDKEMDEARNLSTVAPEIFGPARQLTQSSDVFMTHIILLLIGSVSGDPNKHLLSSDDLFDLAQAHAHHYVPEEFKPRPRARRQEQPVLYVYDPDLEEESGPWGDWSQSGSCSRTCGGGVLTEGRSCNNPDASQCLGASKRFSSCNIQACPPGLRDFREEQCSNFDNVAFEGKMYQWVPYLKAPRKCELNCMPKGERFYYRHAKTVVDGTSCNQGDGQPRICVAGECLRVGCDGILNSDTKEDKCRICGGDGSDCNTVTGNLDEEDLIMGYNDLLLIPAGATNIHIVESKASNNYLALRNTSGHYFINGNWRVDFPGDYGVAGTTFNYEKKPKGKSGSSGRAAKLLSLFAPEHISALGPTSEPIYVVLLSQEKNPGIEFEYSLPSGAVAETPAKDEGYEWSSGDWDECSVPCGGGFRTRQVFCALTTSTERVPDYLCDTYKKPSANETCNPEHCQPTWKTGAWSDCSGNGTEAADEECPATQVRNVYCSQMAGKGMTTIVDESMCEAAEKPQAQKGCDEVLDDEEAESDGPKFHVGPWGGCSALCGEGMRKRPITCFKVENGTKAVLEESECGEAKPEAEEPCQAEAESCSIVDWIVSDWSGCGEICGRFITHELLQSALFPLIGDDVGGEENQAKGVPRRIRPILTVEGSPRLHGHCMHSELIEAGQTCPLQ
eukprot:maker-scaffold239_size242058-snap-gene-1.23 protein:Tk09817 transcript:maker-scaffold239_size242058-snap-gene-1.23-mRNA-1 annotation:"GH25513p"